MDLLAARRYFRLVPFDTRTEQGRQDERYRLAALSILANVLSKAIGIFVMVLSVGLTIPYLGVERFGVWMTVASFAGMLTFLDLGIGNALTNHVAQRITSDKPEVICQTISGGLALLAAVGAFIAVTLWIIAANLPWGTLVRVDQPELLVEARQAAMCFALLFGLNIFTTGIQRVFAGMQQAYLGHLAIALGSLFACAGLWLAAATHQGIPVLLTVVLGSQSAGALLLLGVLVVRKQFTLIGISRFARFESRHLFRAGGLFFILQIGTMVGWGADSLIISSTLGAAQVAVFSVVQRLFQFATQPLSIMNAPLWAAYADAHVRNDRVFIRKTLRKSMSITLAGTTLVAVLLLVAHPWLIEKWTHGKITAPVVFVATYAIWIILEACGNAFAMFLNGAGIVKQQISVVILFVVIALPLKLLLVDSIALLAVPVATILAYVISTIGLYSLVHIKDIRQRLG